MNDGDSILLARIDERVQTLIESHNTMEEWMKKQDDRICQLEACKNQSVGVVVGVSFISSAIMTIGALAISLWTGIVK